MSLKNPVTPPGIDPGTVGLVAQRTVTVLIIFTEVTTSFGRRTGKEFFLDSNPCTMQQSTAFPIFSY